MRESGEVSVSVEAAADPLGLVASALAAAVSLGLLVISGTVFAVDALRANGNAASLDLRFYLLVGGTLLGVFGAALVSWRLLAPISSVYRRGGLSIVSGFATVLMMLVCIPINQLFGRSGLLFLLAASGGLAFTLSRQARRWSVPA